MKCKYSMIAFQTVDSLLNKGIELWKVLQFMSAVLLLGLFV